MIITSAPILISHRHSARAPERGNPGNPVIDRDLATSSVSCPQTNNACELAQVRNPEKARVSLYFSLH